MEMEGCYSGGSIAGAILGTLITLLLLEAAAYYLWRRYWKSRKGQHLVLVTDPEKGGDQYAFDNPCFRDVSTVPRGVLDTKSHIGSDLKSRVLNSWSPLGQIAAVRQLQASSAPQRRRALDDSFTAAPQTKQVSLRSHDFAGLGFSICGNMRDGIFVKDMLHRGPASESGCITPGDRIHSIRINLQHIVLEDALTILSYASPYEVTLELENACSAAGAFPSGASPAVATAANAMSTSSLLRRERERLNATADRICHPFYRSQSIADLAHIGKSSTKRSLDVSTTSTHSSRDAYMHEHPTLKMQSPSASKETSLTTVASFSKDKMPHQGTCAVLPPSSCVMAKPERARKPVTHEKEAHTNASPEHNLEHLQKFGVRVLPVLEKKSGERLSSDSPDTPKRVGKAGVGPERHGNERNTYLERGIDVPDNYTPFTSTPAKPDYHPGFHEIDLGESVIEKTHGDYSDTHKHRESNVKTILTKGLQNIKDKFHSLERKKPKTDTRTVPPDGRNIEESGSPPPPQMTQSPSSQLEKTAAIQPQEGVILRMPSGRGIPTEIPEEVRMAALAARSNRKSVGPNVELETEERPQSCDSSASGDSNQEAEAVPCTAPKRGNKRKAPKPPRDDSPTEDIEIELKQDTNVPQSDSESDIDDRRASADLACPVIVSDDTEKARKAASLVDLSRIDNQVPVGTLERAVSLDLVDGIPQGKKRKAPPVPCSDDNVLSIDVDSDVISRKEPRLEGTLSSFETGRLKKSSDWGTLEEALKDTPSPDSTTRDCRNSSVSSENDQVVVLSLPPMSDVTSNDSEGPLSSGQIWNRSEPYDSIPEVGHYSFEMYSSTAEPLSIEIKGDPQPQEKTDAHRAKFLWAVPTSESSENRTVFCVTPDPTTSHVSISGPPSGPTSLTMVSSTAVNVDSISPDSTQPTHISLTDVHVTTLQLNSLEDSTANAFVTAAESLLEDDEETSESEPVTPPSLPTSPVPVLAPSSLTYITEIHVKPSEVKPEAENSASPQPGRKQNGVESTDEDISKQGEEIETNGTYEDEEDSSSPVKHFNGDSSAPTSPDNTLTSASNSSPEMTPTTVRPTAKSTPTKASRNVSVTAIQGSRIPVRSASLNPEDRASRSPIRPPVPARRVSDHGLQSPPPPTPVESPKRTIPRPKDEGRKLVNFTSLNNGATNTTGATVTVKNGVRGSSEVRVVNSSLLARKHDSD